MPADEAATPASLGPIRQIDAGALSIGYAELGPANGPVAILVHGWPYDIHSFEEVAPLLAAAGYQVIVPYLRGYGSTRFLASDAPRNAQQSAIALDIIALMDALKIEKAVLAGFDWGARTVDIMAALWPERCLGLVSVSGYLIGSPAAKRKPLPPEGELQWWYQFYFATDRGADGYAANTQDFNRLIWRLGLAQGESKYDELEKRLAAAPTIVAPAITMEGDANGAAHLPPAAYAKFFTGKYQHRNLSGGIGHNLPQEAPKAFAEAVMQVTRL